MSITIHRVFLPLVSVVAAFAFIAGCDEIDQMNENANKRPPVMMPPQVVDAPGNQTSTPQKPADNANAAANNPTPTPDVNPTTQPSAPADATREKFAAGMGKQGQGYGGDVITEPIHQYFGMRDQILVSQLKHQLDLWKAEHGFRYPKDKDEYMREIVQACGVELPELPAGHYYEYNAKTGELLVVQPKRAQ